MSRGAPAGWRVLALLAWVGPGAPGVAGCGGDGGPIIPLVRVTPEADPSCGAPDEGRILVVSARGDMAAAEVVRVSRPLAELGSFLLADLPATTRVIEVEILGDDAAVSTVGRTGVLDLEGWPEGEPVAVFMAPLDGLCATGPPARARLDPLLARAGDHVIVAGGRDQAGRPVPGMERYDAATGGFQALALDHYGAGEHGLVGASVVAVDLGRGTDAASSPGPGPVESALAAPEHVLIAGGGVPAYQIYSALEGSLSAPFFLPVARAHHAALALDGGVVLLAGGCGALAPDHGCDPGSALRTSTLLDVGRNEARPGPPLARARIQGVALRESRDAVLLVGGVGDDGLPVTELERVSLAGAPGQLIPGHESGAAALLDSGAALFGTASPGGAAAAGLSVLPPGGLEARRSLDAPWPVRDARMTSLESGEVLVSGATAAGQPTLGLYRPAAGTMVALETGASDPLPGPGHGAIRLADGAVLLVGGRAPGDATGTPQARAWIVRPSLVGPFTSDLFISFAEEARSRPLVPRDPEAHERVPASPSVPAHLQMRAGPGGGALPVEWATLAGPVLTGGRLDLRARSLGAGLALMLGFRAPDDHMVITVAPGQPVTVYRVRGETVQRLTECQGAVIETMDLAPPDPTAPAALSLEFARDTLALRIEERPVLTCDVLSEPVPMGRVAVGVIGTQGATLRVDALAISR